MPVNITNRADAEGDYPRTDCIKHFSGRTEAVRIYEHGQKASKYDIKSDQNPCA